MLSLSDSKEPQTLITPKEVVLSLGSNIEPRREYLKAACDALKNAPNMILDSISSIYETMPIDVPDEDINKLFLNLVVIIKTTLPPLDLLRQTQAIEKQLGRVRSGKHHEARKIDIDIITYADYKINEPTLIIPHPEARNRDFVLTPLRELRPEFSWQKNDDREN